MKKLETEMSSLRTELSTNVQARTAENEKLAAELTATMHKMLKVQVKIIFCNFCNIKMKKCTL